MHHDIFWIISKMISLTSTSFWSDLMYIELNIHSDMLLGQEISLLYDMSYLFSLSTRPHALNILFLHTTCRCDY